MRRFFFCGFFFLFFFLSLSRGLEKNPIIGESRPQCQSETVSCSSSLPVRNLDPGTLGAQAQSNPGQRFIVLGITPHY